MRENTNPMEASASSSASPSNLIHDGMVKNSATTDNILKSHHALLISLSNTFIQLTFKVLPAFIPYIMEDYSFSYAFTVAALSIGALSTSVTLFVNPLILYLPTNVVFCIFLLLESLSCLILWYFRHSKAMFIVGVIIACFIENSCYGCSLAVISTFTTDATTSHNYLSALNAGWTVATFMFLGVGWVMNLGSVWLFLEIMFVIYVICAVLNIVFLPRQSANRHNLDIMANCNTSKAEGQAPLTVNIKDDMRVLCKIKSYWYTLLTLVVVYIGWSYFYATFGLWLKQVFKLDQATFGYIAGLAEGFGNLFGILSVAYLSKSDDSAHNELNKCNKISLQALMLWGSVVMMVFSIVIWCVNFTAWYNEIFIFIWIALYFTGLEATCCAALTLIVNVVPPLQQARGSAIMGVMQSVTLFFAQLTIAPVYYHLDGMKWESFLLFVLYLLSTVIIIHLNKIMKDPKLDPDELLPINKDKHIIQNYT